MNLGIIRKHCCARKTALILNAGRRQWISDGANAWPVEGVKNLDADGVAALFGLSAKKRAAMEIRSVDMGDDPRYSLEPTEGETWEAVKEIGAIAWDDEIFIAISTAGGVMFLPRSAVKHVKPENRRFGVRWAAGKWPIIACYGDALVSVLMTPMNLESERALRCMAGRMAAPAWEPEEEKAATAEAKAEDLLKMMEGKEQ